MAYIPDQAIEQMDEISSKAFMLYCYYCKHGSMRKNTIRIDLKSAARDLFKNDLSNAAKYHRELKSEKWIEQTPISGEITLTKGNFYPKEVVNFTTKTDTNQMVEFTTKKDSEVVNSTTESGKFYHLHNKDSFNQPFKPANTKSSSSADSVKGSEPIPRRIPAEFSITDEMRTWAKNHKTVSLIEDLEDATEKWHLHWSSAAGDRAKSTDWIAVWKKGMIAHFEYEQRRNNGGEKQNGNKNGAGTRRDEKSAGAGEQKHGAGEAVSGKYTGFGANPHIIK